MHLPRAEALRFGQTPEFFEGFVNVRQGFIENALAEVPRCRWRQIVEAALVTADGRRRWEECEAAERGAKEQRAVAEKAARRALRVEVPRGWTPPLRVRARA